MASERGTSFGAVEVAPSSSGSATPEPTADEGVARGPAAERTQVEATHLVRASEPSRARGGAEDASPAAAGDLLSSLALALERASAAGQWDIVAILAKELEARRLEAAGNVVAIHRRKS